MTLLHAGMRYEGLTRAGDPEQSNYSCESCERKLREPRPVNRPNSSSYFWTHRTARRMTTPVMMKTPTANTGNSQAG